MIFFMIHVPPQICFVRAGRFSLGMQRPALPLGWSFLREIAQVWPELDHILSKVTAD